MSDSSTKVEPTPPPPAEEAPRPVANAGAGDVALLLGGLPDGGGVAVLRKRAEDAPVEVGALRPMKEGQAIHGEVVKLNPREGAPLLCDVEVMMDAPRATPPRKGPAKVATEGYRSGWDRIFGPS